MATEEDIYDSIDARLQKTGGPAFPLARQTPSDHEGMDLRDWFAGQAVASGVINDDPGEKERAEMGISAGSSQLQIIAAVAYHLADAMIAARKAGA